MWHIIDYHIGNYPIISIEQSFLPGLNINLYTNCKLSEKASIRISPGLMMNTQKIFLNNDKGETLNWYDFSSLYAESPVDLIFNGARKNNIRGSIIIGIIPQYGYSYIGESGISSFNLWAEVGCGLDSYTHFSKYRTEIKYSFGLLNDSAYQFYDSIKSGYTLRKFFTNCIGISFQLPFSKNEYYID
jgi:hypothetical protein